MRLRSVVPLVAVLALAMLVPVARAQCTACSTPGVCFFQSFSIPGGGAEYIKAQPMSGLCATGAPSVGLNSLQLDAGASQIYVSICADNDFTNCATYFDLNGLLSPHAPTSCF